MRILIILTAFTLAACAKSESAEPSEAFTFIPRQCSFVQAEAADTRYASGTVNKYACTSELQNMNCYAYAQGEDYLYLQCSLKSLLVPQGTPSGCERVDDGSSAHEFLDGNMESSYVYDCGTQNANLRCFYFESKSTAQEEMRCNLM